MKPKYLLYAIPLLALASCSSDEPGPGGGLASGGAAVVSADIGSPSSRAADTQWGKSDCIGISGTTGTVAYVNVPYATHDGDGIFEALNGVPTEYSSRTISPPHSPLTTPTARM